MKVIKKKKILKLAILFICLLTVFCSLKPGSPVLAATDESRQPDSSIPTPKDIIQAGPYPTTTKSFPGYTVFCPRTLGENEFKHPVITWGNGTFSTPSLYSGLLRHLASYGFVLVCSNSTNTGTGRAMINGIDLMERENGSVDSFFYDKLNMMAVGACGHSQGGMGTINAARDSQVICSAPIMPLSASPAGVKGPMFIITGSLDFIINSGAVKAEVYNPFDGTAVFGEIRGASHLDPMGIFPSATLLKYLTGWFELYLMNDSSRRSMFFGAGSEISNDRLWQSFVKEKVVEPLELAY